METILVDYENVSTIVGLKGAEYLGALNKPEDEVRKKLVKEKIIERYIRY